jgi:hypothetical protein
MSSPFDAVNTYFLAKDGNRPFLMRRASAEDADLEMVVPSVMHLRYCCGNHAALGRIAAHQALSGRSPPNFTMSVLRFHRRKLPCLTTSVVENE